MKPSAVNVRQETLHRLLLWGGLIAMPLLLMIRWDVLVAPNEEPKWLVFVLLATLLSIAGSLNQFLKTRDSSAPKLTLKIDLPRGIFILYFIGLALGTTYAVNPEESLLRLSFWCSFGVLFVVSAINSQTSRHYLSLLSTSLIFSGLLLTLWFWHDFFLSFNEPGFDKFTRFSRIGHFNFTADTLVTLLPMLVWALLDARTLAMKILAGFVLASGCFMLMASGSLGGTGGFIAGGLLAGIVSWAAQSPALAQRTQRPIDWKPVLISLTLVAALIASVKPVFDQLPKEYREQILTRAEWGNPPKAEDLQAAQSLPPLTPLWLSIMPYLGARTPMWASTAGMIAERPWLGFGTGSYLVEYPNFNKRFDLFVDFEVQGRRIKTNPHNIILQIAAENGLPMAILFCGLYLWLIAAVLREALRKRSPFWSCGLWALLAAGLDAQVNHVFFNPTSLYLAALIFGVLYGRLPQQPTQPSLEINLTPRTPLSAILISLTAIVLFAVPVRWVVSEYYFAKASALDTPQGSPSLRQIKIILNQSLAWSKDNIRALYGLASIEYRMGQIDKSAEALVSFLKLAPYHTGGLIMLAGIQISHQQLDLAEQNLHKALRIDPDDLTIKEKLDALTALRQGQTSPPKMQTP